MRALIALVLVGLTSPLPSRADADVRLAPGSVAVYRGSEAPVAPAVPIYRGSAVRPAYLAQAPVPAPATVGGRNLWFVDRAAGELTSCRTINTFDVGQRRIRCTRAALPGS
jgi:hypothetical protein